MKIRKQKRKGEGEEDEISYASVAAIKKLGMFFSTHEDECNESICEKKLQETKRLSAESVWGF